jgi:hypothetical protein
MTPAPRRTALANDDEDAGADDGADPEGGEGKRSHRSLEFVTGLVGLLD